MCERLHAEQIPDIRNRWPDGAKSVRQAERVAQLENLIVAELDDPIARRAVQVIVARRSVVVLEGAAVGQTKFAKQPRLDQQTQGTINGRPAHLVTGIVQVAHQFVSVEVLVRIKDMTDKHPAWLRQLLAPDFQELTEFLNRRLGVDHGCQSITLHFRPDSDTHTGPSTCRPSSSGKAGINNDSPF